MLNWSIEKIGTSNLIVKVEEKDKQGVGEVIADGALGETARDIEECFSYFEFLKMGHLDGLEELTGFLDGIEIPQGLRFGIESAYIHYLADVNDISVQEILCLNQIKSIPVSFFLPSMVARAFPSFYRKNDLHRFESLKIKIDGMSSLHFIEQVASIYGGKIRLDAGNSFHRPEDVVTLLDALCSVPIEFIKRPMPFNEYGPSKELKESVNIPIITDIPVGPGSVTKEFRECFDGVHIELTRSGGYIKGPQPNKNGKGC